MSHENPMNVFNRVSIGIILLLSLSSCASNKNIDAKLSYWKESLNSNIPVGTSKEKVDEYLEQSGLEYSYIESEKIYSAGDRDVNNRWIMYEAMVSITIYLNNEFKVEKYVIDDQYSGL